MSACVYDQGLDLLTRRLDWERDDVRVLLLDWNYRPDEAAHWTVRDIARCEVAPSGTYTRGGSPVAGRWRRQNWPGADFGIDTPVEWTGFTGRFRYAVFYGAADGVLLACVDHGRQEMTRGNIRLVYPDGLISVVVDEDEPEAVPAHPRAGRRRAALAAALAD